MVKLRIKDRLADAVCCVAGASLFSVAVNVFSVPNGVSLGGFTGVATMLNHVFPSLPVGTVILVLNLPLFVLSWIRLGGGFLFKTVVFTAVYSLAVDVGALFLPGYIGDSLLACVFCGVVSGSGLALAFLRGATTGGTDIIARLLHSRFAHISMGRLVLLVDAVIVVAAGFVYGKAENSMYSAIVIYVTSRLIDYVLYGAGSGRLLFIVTERAAKLSEEVFNTVRRGVTVLPVKGGYTGNNKSLLLCAVRPSETARLYRAVKEIDPHAFTVVVEAGEVLGEGFKLIQ